MLTQDEEDFVPSTSTGKQKSPNQIRNEIQRYIDASSESQTCIVKDRLGLSYSSFSKFMNPKTYKNQWSAIQNGTYWRAARFLEQYKHEQKIAKKTNAAAAAGSKKRKSSSNDENNVNSAAGPDVATKKSKTETKKEIESYMERVMATTLPHGTGGRGPLACTRVYDGCPEIVKKIKDFYKRDGVTKASFCRVIGNINANSMNQFLMKKKQDGAGMIAYPQAYFFFERMRIMENKSYSKKRLQNEVEHPNGFRLEAPRKSKFSARFLMSL